jgi:IS30 family transposase
MNEKRNKHLTYEEKQFIEIWHNKDKKSSSEIAKLLHKSERTIRRELKRGFTKAKDTYLRVISVYSADVSNKRYEYNKTAKGPAMILDCEPELVKYISERIKRYKESPEVIVSRLRGTKHEGKICAKTIRNAIKSGDVFIDITVMDLTYKKRFKAYEKRIKCANKISPARGIDKRPKEADDRSEYGHWEGDLVVGSKNRGAVLFTLTERKLREEIIVKLDKKRSKNVIKTLDELESKYGKEFKNKFKTITFDNGVEFKDYKGMEKSIDGKSKRLDVYYAHPYCSSERGSNENANRLIRRWIPKGASIDEISESFVKFVEDWINDYPRAMFGYKSTNMLLSEI